MEGTAEFHHQIPNPGLEHAAGLLEDAAALDTTIDMLDGDATTRQILIRHLLLVGQLPTPRFAAGRLHPHLWEAKGQKAQVLQQFTARR